MQYDNLPYGAYVCRESVVFFDRKYRPLISLPWTHYEWDGTTGRLVLKRTSAKIVAPETRINFEAQRWFYNDGTPKAARARLHKRLVDAFPLLREARP
jgi:hypothetical protein